MNLNIVMFFPIIRIGFTMIKMEPLQMGGVFPTVANIIGYVRIWIESPMKVFFFRGNLQKNEIGP